MKGKLIVFEGTDGSGKSTQAKMMARRLREEGVRFHEIDFPRYGNPFAEPARLYLQGDLYHRIPPGKFIRKLLIHTMQTIDNGAIM